MTPFAASPLLAVLSIFAACALTIALLGGLRWWLLDCSQGLRRVITAALFFVGFVSGVSGFMSEGEALGRAPGVQAFTDAWYATLQLVFLGVESSKTHGVRLGIARVLLPLATTQLVLAAILARARQWLLRARLRVGQADVVILGCTETGLQIARLFERLIDPDAAGRASASAAIRRRILGVNESLTSPLALEFQERYWLLQAPLGTDEALRALGPLPRSGIVVCTGDEQSDLTILKQVVASLKPLPPVVVSVTSDALPRTCRLDPELTSAYARGRIQFVNPAHLDARLLYRTFPPHAFARGRFRIGHPVTCHIALFVAPEAVDALTAQAVRALVYDPNEPLRLTIFAEDTRAASEQLFAHYPSLTQSETAWTDPAYGRQLPLARISLATARADRIDPVAVRRAHAAQSIDVVYVLGRSDGESCLRAAEALKAVATLDGERPAVVVCLRDLTAAGHLAQAKGLPERRFFHVGSWAEPESAASELASLLARERGTKDATPANDAAAARLWTKYRAQNGGDMKVMWGDAEHDTKWWNRFAADHADIKLALLGLSPTAASDDVLRALQEPGMRDGLSRLEHRRYVCERLVDGWLRSEKKFNEYRLNPTLAPFDDPSVVGQQAKDEAIVDDLLKTIGDGAPAPGVAA